MRKLLLTGTALVGSIGLASAQTTPAPVPMTSLQGSISSYNGVQAGNNNQNSDGSTPAPGPFTPTPGTVVIHLNARVNTYAAVGGGSFFNYTNSPSYASQFVPNTATGALGKAPTGGVLVAGTSGIGGGSTYSVAQPYGTAKLSPEQFLGYFRLYPGVDAMATNGLRYGGIVEIRQNFAGQTDNLQIVAPNGVVNGGAGSNFSTSPSGSSCSSTLYVRREAVYFGTNQLGIVRIGQDDGPFSQFDGGVTTFQNFNDGAWNGDVPAAVPANAQPTFPFWSGVGAEYDVYKAVYFSPTFWGFDGAISFAPNNAAATDSACPVAGSGCANTLSAPDPNFGGGARPINWYEVMGRYRNTFGGVGVYAIGGYSGSGHTSVPTFYTVGPNTSAGGTKGAAGAQYQNFSVGDVGLALTYAGVTVGGNVVGGQMDGQVALMPQGGVQAIAWVAGAQYANGPLTVGASYYKYNSQGAQSLVHMSQRYDEGIAAGLTYSVAPGMNAYISYLYGQIYQGGYNFGTASAGAANNNVHSQAFAVGTRVFW